MEKDIGKDKYYYDVYFSRNSTDLPKLEGSAIVFVPINDDWNDFHYRCRYEYSVFDKNSNLVIKGKLLLGFVGNDERIQTDGRIKLEKPILSASEAPEFFTLLGGMNDYRKFISELGVGLSNEILLYLHDLVALRKSSDCPNWVSEAIKSEAFALSFMRDSEWFLLFIMLKHC